MKLSDESKLYTLMQERRRLRDAVGELLIDEDISIKIKGTEAQGNVRNACVEAVRQVYDIELEANTKRLQEIGVDPDDGPVRPAARRSDMISVGAEQPAFHRLGRSNR